MIRPLHPDDAPGLYELFHEPSPLWCDHFGPDTSPASFRAYVDLTASENHRMVAIRDNHLAGLGILKRFPRDRLTHSGEINLLLPDKSTSYLVGQELLSALLDLADNWLNFKRLETALPTFSTDFSVMLRRYGFEPEGAMKKSIRFDGRFYDEISYARLRNLDKNQPAKRPAHSLSDRKPAKLDPASLMIRQLEDQDIDDLYQMFSSPENCRTTLQLPSLELWVTRQRVLQPPPGILRLVAVYDERVIGVISLMPRPELCRSHTGRIGMMVHPDFWGQGIGSRLMNEILGLADEMLGLKRVELQVHTDNPAGIRLYEKSGFVIEGTKYFQNYGGGGWVDTHFMAHLIE